MSVPTPDPAQEQARSVQGVPLVELIEELRHNAQKAEPFLGVILFDAADTLAALAVSPEERGEAKCYCGTIEWTVKAYGRLMHKHGCPVRTDPFCQGHPTGCPAAGGAEGDTE